MAPSTLALANVEGQRRIREAMRTATGRIWESLPDYREANIDEWLTRVLPVIASGQDAAARLMDAYLARSMERQPLGVVIDPTTLRNGATPEEVYRRPFETVWTSLAGGSAFDQAVAAGGARAVATSAMNTQLAMRGAATAINEADPEMFGFTRVADGAACSFCQEVDGAYVKSGDAMALHNNCGCSLEPNTAPHPRAARLPSGVAVHAHGELGPLLVDPAHAFTGPADI